MSAENVDRRVKEYQLELGQAYEVYHPCFDCILISKNNGENVDCEKIAIILSNKFPKDSIQVNPCCGSCSIDADFNSIYHGQEFTNSE